MSDDLTSLDPTVRWIVTELRRPVITDPAARAQLLEAVRNEPLPERRSSVVAWLLQPRTHALPPLASLAAAAGLIGIGVIAGLAIHRDGRAPTELSKGVAAASQLPDSSAARVVKFVLIAPQAARVAVVGDFNGWDSAATPAVRQPDGTWATFVTLRPGRHVYSFVVDGTHFVSDPNAPLESPDDGYGNKNSVVVVTGVSS